MKASFKKVGIILFALMISLSSFAESSVYAASSKYTQANEIAQLCYQGYKGGNSNFQGPIIITKGIYTNSKGSKDVYLVTLSGTEKVENQATYVKEDILSGFNLNNKYLKNTVKAIKEYVPTGSNIMLAGHSLGGMIAQQVAGNSDIKKNYNVLNTVTFGSPLINEGHREGTVKRLGDSKNVVPYLSATGNIIWEIAGLNREDGGYKNAIEAHSNSYTNPAVWGKYDVTGTKNGDTTLLLDLDTRKCFQSPSK